jgi:hypothetical protein
MRYFAYLFHAVLALFLLGVSGLALASGTPDLKFGMLPWAGSTLNYVLFFGALAGLTTVLLALRGKLPVLFLVWSAAVALLLVKGYVFSGYKFGTGEWKTAVFLLVASFLAIPGAWSRFRAKPHPRKKKFQVA